MTDAAAIARWLLALEVVGWGLYPFLYFATPGLRDRGLTVAKPFALLLLIYPAWWLASFGLPVFTAPVLLFTLTALALLGWGLALRQSQPVSAPDQQANTNAPHRAMLPAFLRASWRYALAVEGLFIVSFLAYAWLRGYNPQILGTEKPMESGFLAATTRGTTMPPPDPWLSGYGINYYYLGYVIVAGLAKLTAIAPSLAFNLGLATVVATTFTGGAGTLANLLGRRDLAERANNTPRLPALAAGLLGGYLLALAGNMYAARDILARGRQAIDVWWWGGLGWKSSRVVIDSGFPARFFGSNAPPSETIDEFPFFSFILGDLHAHVLALPFTVLALSLALDVWLAPLAGQPNAAAVPDGSLPDGALTRERGHQFASWLPSRFTCARLGVAALVIGALYALNSWDLPTYAALYLAAIVLPGLVRGGVTRRVWTSAAIFVALCVALFAPYYAHFTSLVGGQPVALPEPFRSWPLLPKLSSLLGLVIWGKTPADQFFTVYLLPYLAGLFFLTWRWRRTRGAGGVWTTPALTVLALGLAATLLRMPVFFLAGLLIALTVASLSRAPLNDGDSFATLLFGGAFALVLVTEVLFIHDIFGNRMNTVFKVYYQAWTLLAIAAGYAVVRVIFDRRHWFAEGGWRLPAATVMTLLLLASTAYPLVASWARTDHFKDRQGLDGLAFVRTVAPDEYAGIRWVQDNVPAGTVVAEAPGCSYGEWLGVPHNRVSTFAGVSTPLGWAGHEQQWRGGAPERLAEIGPRATNVNTLYSTTDTAQAEAILDRYQIRYVYVGFFERNGYRAGGIGADCNAGPPYPAAGLAKFDTLLEPVFTSGSVTIYQRPPGLNTGGR